MNLFRTLGGAASLCLTAAGLNGCISAPDYAIEPEIEFNSLQLGRVIKPGELEKDTLYFALDFKDGDGDLGLSSTDIAQAPWNIKTGGPNGRGNAYNYIIQPFKKVGTGTSTRYEQYITPFGFKGEYDGTYPRLDGTDAKPAPLKGTLRYKLPLTLDGLSYNPGDTFRFEISILDRALHRSKTITTSDVTLGR